jgi:cytochrome c oxidase subunit 2
VLLIVGVGTVVTLSELNAEPAPTALHVKVEGQQWWWRFSYDMSNDGRGNGSFTDAEDIVTANELVIPVGREIALSETSNDVIHSFWIPALNGKKDAVPGMITDWKIQADTIGVFRGQCTEFCGLSHANMRMLVRAVGESEFGTWTTQQRLPAKTPAPGTPAAAGEVQFKGLLCASCHLIRGVNDAQVADPATGVKTQLVPGVAPDLTHFASRGTFAGSIFNSHYPNPTDVPEIGTPPFTQTCKVRGEEGYPDIDGARPDDASLPACPAANQFDTFGIPYAAAPGNPGNPIDAVAIESWLRDPPKMKPMAPLPEENPDAGGRRRGMPNLKLSEEQIDQLVAYLSSLS